MLKENETLNDKELEKISGGETYDSLDELSFLYGKGLHVEVKRFRFAYHQFTAGGTITAYGYTHINGKYSPAYYIKCDNNEDYSGWYDEDYLQDSTYTSWEKIDESKVVVVNYEG